MQFFFTFHAIHLGGARPAHRRLGCHPALDEMVQSRTQINTLVANPFASMAISRV